MFVSVYQTYYTIMVLIGIKHLLCVKNRIISLNPSTQAIGQAMIHVMKRDSENLSDLSKVSHQVSVRDKIEAHRSLRSDCTQSYSTTLSVS